jgi:hypothetical protein
MKPGPVSTSTDIVLVYYLYDPVTNLYYKGSGTWEREMRKAKMYRGRGMASNAAANYAANFDAYATAFPWRKIARENQLSKSPQIKDLEILKFEFHQVRNFVEKFKPKCSKKA